MIDPGKLWRLSLAELRDHHTSAVGADAAALFRALGSASAVADFKRLDRMRNSIDPARADRGAAEFDQRFGNLSAAQEQLVYGIGDRCAQADEILEVLEAHTDFDDDAPLAVLARMAVFGAQALTPEDLEAVTTDRGSTEAQAAVIRLTRACAAMKRRGLAQAEIVAQFAVALADAGWSSGDANDAFRRIIPIHH